MRKILVALSLATLLPGAAQAWWNADWAQRTQVSLNTTAQGVETKESLSGVVVPVRLHSGNFDFLSAKPDGADLRVVAGDDKTPLKFWMERYDSANELAVVWVQLPAVLPGSDKNTLFVYAGNEAAAVESSSPALFDAAMLAAFTFSEKDGVATDASGALKTGSPVAREVNGLMGSAARLDGQQPLLIASAGKLVAPAAGPYSLSLWIKPDAAAGTILQQGPLALAFDGSQLVASVGDLKLSGGDVPAQAWTHVLLTLGAGKATLYVNGTQSAQADLPATLAVQGDLALGQGYTGLVDQLEVAGTVRSGDWARLTHALQSADAKLVAAVTQTPDSAEQGEAGEAGHMGVLVDNLTVDAWVVIIILGIMFVVAAWVMYDKTILVGRADKANRAFLQSFRQARDVMVVAAGAYKFSPLARMYQAGLHELQKRDVGKAGTGPLSGASIDALKAAIDANMVRESHELNSKMVLLTIAISGGPFLGLLGTVVGVMITFAAIAAAGDVNVNAIAPGIAAALLATVAGLAVAIPALFGYNYLAARIKNVSSDMQIFVDEFVTRVAETYGAR